MYVLNHACGLCETQTTRPDGSEWQHVLILHNGFEVGADTPGEAIAAMIPGYAELDEMEQVNARVGHARTTALALQRILADRAGVSPEETGLMAVLEAPRSEPLGIRDPEHPDAPPRWDASPALVLVTTAYAPHTEAPRIEGNVHWLDPTDEQAYLLSLRDARAFDYWRAGERA